MLFSHPFSRQCALAAVLTATVMGTAAAQVGFEPPPQPVGQAHGLDPQIESILKKMIAAYRDLKSYRDQGRVQITQTTGRVRQITEMPSTVAYQRPNALSVVSGGQSIACDGQTLQIVLDGLRQYTSTQAPATLTMGAVKMGAPGGGLDEGYPEVLAFLLGKHVYPRWLRKIGQIQLEPQQQEIDGRACHVVAYDSVYQAKITMYIDAATHLLARCDIDATETLYGPGAPRPGPDDPQTDLQIRYDLFPIEVDTAIDTAAFEVTPPKGMHRVKRFRNQRLDPPAAQPDQAHAPDQPAVEPTIAPTPQLDPPAQPPNQQPESTLIGSPVPTIQGIDFQEGGQAFESSDTAGKPLVLLLWSPHGGLDNLAAVAMLQRLVDGFESQSNIAFLSITDSRSQPDLLRDLLELKKATFRTLIDTDSLTIPAFGAKSLPMFVAVASDGLVQHVALGASPQTEKTLAKQITLLMTK